MPRTETRHKVSMRFDIATKSIDQADRSIKVITNIVYAMQIEYMDKMYKNIYTWAKRWTMVATGETRSKLFYTKRSIGRNYKWFIAGYMPTTNNQSVAQEFDLGPVHRKKSSHYYKDGSPKCSTHPNDVYSLMGRSYTENPTARRRALALAVSKVFGSPVRFAVKESGNFRYQPNLTPTLRRLTAIASAVTRSV